MFVFILKEVECLYVTHRSLWEIVSSEKNDLVFTTTTKDYKDKRGRYSHKQNQPRQRKSVV